MTTGTIVWIADGPQSKLCPFIKAVTNYTLARLTRIEDLDNRVLDGTAAPVVVELPFPGWTGEQLLNAIREAGIRNPVIFADPSKSIGEPQKLIERGAYYCSSSELTPEPLVRMIRAACEHHGRLQIANLAARVEETWRKTLIGQSTGMQRVAELIRLIAPRRSTVLITGETGTGKEVVAKAIHMASDRAGGPMVAVNCSSLPEALLEAELFGHAKGAFTGAVGQRIGRFEQANRGTIFLDEIGDLPLETQGKLLRVLQEREFERVGSTETIKVDVRVIAATNVDLSAAVRKKTFREDLYYRLSVIPINLPPLRCREGDVPSLVQYFVDKLCGREGLPPKFVTPEVLDHLSSFHWPGNVRQLEHAVEVAIVLSGDRTLLTVDDFPLPRQKDPLQLEALLNLPQEGLDFDGMICEIQRFVFRHAMKKTGGNKSRAAEILHMKRSTLVSKMKALG